MAVDTDRLPVARPGHHRGSNQSHMRAHNERVLLTLIRDHGQLSKIQIARMTGLSAQTTSVIMRALEADGLLRREAPVRGRVGQPSVPMSLDPDGAFFFGLNVGRRNAELVLIDFLGRARSMSHDEYRYPDPDAVMAFARTGIDRMSAELTPEQRRRIGGLGVAMPFELWAWADREGAPKVVMDRWRSVDLRATLAAGLPYPVSVQNDATAACGAELMLGPRRDLQDWLYFFVGAFVGGGVVLGGRLFSGRSGNAGALGSMLVPQTDAASGQLLQIASLALLEESIEKSGVDSSVFWASPDNWSDAGESIDAWLETAGRGLAHAIVSASSVIDFEAVVIDGWLPVQVRERLVQGSAKHLLTLPSAGVRLPQVLPGSVGIHASALGAACMVLSDRYLLENHARAVPGDQSLLA